MGYDNQEWFNSLFLQLIHQLKETDISGDILKVLFIAGRVVGFQKVGSIWPTVVEGLFNSKVKTGLLLEGRKTDYKTGS